MAEPLDHAYVFNFDQFYLPEDTDEHLADGGLLLMAELNCTACHAAPDSGKERLAPKPGPDLSGVGSRLSADALWLLIRSPQHRKKGTQMPGLFANEEGDAEKVEALVEYLSSLKEPAPKTKVPKGDADSGKKLYHEAGCVACHEPATDYRPPGAPKDGDVEKPGLASVPIALADDYDEAALARFLFDPLHARPAGRMPSMHLSEKEAADIAAYLHTGRTPEKTNERAALQIPKQTAEKGRALFVEMKCVACHQAEPKTQMGRTSLIGLTKLDGAKGCLAEKQPTGTPRYDLNELQRRALKLALAVVKKEAAPKLDAMQAVDWQMSRLNCYACHDRDGKGGPEDPRAAYFGANDAGAESLGQFAHLPPMLDGVGHKITPTWLAKLFWGEDGSVRPYMNVRMPNFGKAQTESLIPLLAEADKAEKPVNIDVSGLQKHHRAEAGRALMGTKGLACVACHGLKDKKSLGPPVIRLTHTVERLQPEYFKELLLNPQVTQKGTMMPPLFVGRKKADQEIESIWTYLREIDGQPLPEGLLSTEDFELKPAKAGRPIVFRSFIEGAGSHAIGVGFPEGFNAAFDAVKCEWTVVWRGRFLDAISNWQSREMQPIKPLGTDVKTLPEQKHTANFQGYRLDKAGVPTMLYTIDGKEVEDRIEVAKDGKGLVRTVNGKQEAITW